MAKQVVPPPFRFNKVEESSPTLTKVESSDAFRAGESLEQNSIYAKNASYAELFYRLLDGALIIDAESYQVMDFNNSCERIFKREGDQLRSLKLTEIIQDELKEEFVKRIRKSKRKYYPTEFETVISTPEMISVPIRMSICPLELKTGEKVMQVIAKDITKEKETEERAAEYLLEVRDLKDKFEKMSITDEMTQLYNFRNFKKRLSEEHERAQRHNVEYSILFFDLDNFKHYNDRNGHPAGDELLRQLAKVISSSVRNIDIAARYGGEEFAVICPETNHAGALIFAERLRSAIENTKFEFAEFQPLGKVSASIGVSTFPSCGATPEQVLEHADQSVYVSKKSGRNRVTSAEDLLSGKVQKVA